MKHIMTFEQFIQGRYADFDAEQAQFHGPISYQYPTLVFPTDPGAILTEYGLGVYHEILPVNICVETHGTALSVFFDGDESESTQLYNFLDHAAGYLASKEFDRRFMNATCDWE
ncbi:hypothetical protein [Faecalibaculum rodentium]|uniref:hypothetical protein n=1 Tax=Faecalibaculum rodentium TaxID=1702221 RepID=UPI00272FA064|nr:hypothetical protein [Faecalibaculum rodentium]